MSSWPGPRRSVERLASERGKTAVVSACTDLLAGHPVEGEIVFALGGPPARWAVDGGPSGPDYWLRVWALRGLLWTWESRATSAVVAALGDDSWRVREAAARVAGRHVIVDATDALETMSADPVDRVRTSAARAVTKIAAAMG